MGWIRRTIVILGLSITQPLIIEAFTNMYPQEFRDSIVCEDCKIESLKVLPESLYFVNELEELLKQKFSPPFFLTEPFLFQLREEMERLLEG